MIHKSEKLCPRCGSSRLKPWNELDEEQQMFTKRIPASAEFTDDERNKHRFCTRCWFEDYPEEACTA